MLTAMWLRSRRSPARKAWGMLAAGIIGVFLGQLWNHWFPINKNLWTSSFVLLAAGFSLIGLAICYWAIEIKNWRKGWTYVWIVFGMNAITAYVFSELLATTVSKIHLHTAAGSIRLKTYVFDHVFMKIPNLHLAALAYSLTMVALSFILVLVLYRKKIFLKV
jgi:predicted acyltransferase